MTADEFARLDDLNHRVIRHIFHGENDYDVED